MTTRAEATIIPATCQRGHALTTDNGVNPTHMEPVTKLENIRRRWSARP